MLIEIEGRLPSWNTFYAGQNHHVRTAMKNKWRLLVRSALTGEEQMFDGPVHITVWAEYKGTPCDVDNVCAKLLIDGLKSYIIPEDDPRYVAGVTCHSRNSKRNYVTLLVERVDGNTSPLGRGTTQGT